MSEYKRQKNIPPSENDEGLIAGRNPVIEALRSDCPLNAVYISPDAGGSINTIVKLAKEKGIPVKYADDKKLTAMTGFTSHQGAVASGACTEYISVEELLDISRKKGTPPFIIVCDEIEDPHNLGAVIRTAEAAGADGIIIPKRRSASINTTVYKTSAGAASILPAARVTNIPAALDKLKDNGVWIYGTDAVGESYTDVSLTGAIALVIGSEGNGLHRLVREKCDRLISLPMYGRINSLNASVAAGIFMYEAVRQRFDQRRT